MSSLVLTVKETLRYRGAIGQWSWVLHRLTGLGVVLFLSLHVIDTSWAVFYPELYVKAIAAYQSPIFTIGEFGLIFAVVYHAFNGLRIAIFDNKPELWKHQSQAAIGVLILTVLVLAPVFLGMFSHVYNFYFVEQKIPTDKLLDNIVFSIVEQFPFIAGFVGVLIAAIILSAIYGVVSGNNTVQAKYPQSSPIERFWWSFMRVSGVLIIPLVFGHLAMMHVVQGVFDITANKQVVMTLSQNVSATAVEFVYHRWSYAAGGLFIWRIYDFFLLVLVTLHGFNGLRYVLTDYTSNHDFLRRASVAFCTVMAVIMLVVGGAALFTPMTTDLIDRAIEATSEIANLRASEEGAEVEGADAESADDESASDTADEEATEEAESE